MSNIIVFGDVHGEADKLKTLIDKCRLKFGDNVQFVSVGDLLDRGPDSKTVVQLCIDNDIRSAVGNHDSWMIGTLKTDDALIKRMEDSAKKPISKVELERQRVSFVYGNLPNDSTITRDRVAAKIKSNEGA